MRHYRAKLKSSCGWAYYRTTTRLHDDAVSGLMTAKKHVIWNINPDMLDKATRELVAAAQIVDVEHEVVIEREESDSTGPRSEELLSSGSQSTTVSEVRAQSNAPAHRMLPIDVPSLSWVRPAYPEDSVAEFFSRTHARWMIGKVSLQAVCGGTMGDNELLTVIYSIRLGFTGQLRQDVELHLLRVPPAVGELVEVFGGSPQPGVIGRIAKVIRHPGHRHYEVLVAGRPRVVPGQFLRRHFPLGSGVFVYRGHIRGWVPGLVAQCHSLEPPDYSRFASPRHVVNLHERVRDGDDHGSPKLRIRFPGTCDPDDWFPAHLVKSVHVI